MQISKNTWIIHGFALLHALATVLCRLAGVGDELLLTLLTMTMTVLLCIGQQRSFGLTAICVILVNVLGYALGTGVALGVERLLETPILSHAVSTFLTTELLGWGIVWFLRRFSPVPDTSGNSAGYSQITWLALAVGGIFFLRLILQQLFSSGLFTGSSAAATLSEILSNPVALLTLIGATVSLIYYTNLSGGRHGPWWVLGISSAGFLLICILTAFLVQLGLPFSLQRDFSSRRFLQLLALSFVCEAAAFSVIYMIRYAADARASMEAERDRANQEKFRYLILKQQVNPHFLFNSLNVLDALVCEQKTQEASDYIHDLSGVYRYLLKAENEPLVSLEDEMTYTDMFLHLMQIRFPDGFVVEKEIRPEDMQRYVVPCSVQLLVENALKHNIISASHPLHVRICSDGGSSLTVTNDLRLKLTPPASTGVGLKYVRQQFLDHGGKTIDIRQDEKTYSVTLPLL